MQYFLLKLIFLLLFTMKETFGTRDGIHEKMYGDLNLSAACFRRLNGTHQFGCSSSKWGNVGIIHIVKNNEDLNTFIAYATSEKYVIALYMNMFTRVVVDQLIKLDNIGGMLLIVQESYLPDNFSPDDVCPNSRMTPCGNHEFNPYGNGILFVDWPFPMFMVDDNTTIDAINKCFNDFNLPFGESQLSRPLCSVQLKSHMSASVNTPTCLRRESEAGARMYKYCDPMGDRNIIYPMVGDFQGELPTKSAIVIAARMDTAAIFDGVSSGAITSATSIVTLLTTASILNKMLKKYNVENKELIFMLFNGEAQDYIGSSRIIYDIQKGEFLKTTSLNFTLENIKSFIEISQIDSSSSVFLHSTKDDTTRDLEKKLITASSNYSVKFILGSLNQLPPSSFQMFHKVDRSIPGIIISSFDQQFTNKYYNGLLDNYKTLTLNQDPKTLNLNINVAEISMTLSTAVFSALTDSYETINREEVDHLVDELLHCYLKTRYCKLMKEVSTGAEGNGPSTPWPLYVSVQPSHIPITTATGLLLAYLTSDRVKLSQENCAIDSNSYSYYWVNGPNNTGLCLNTTMKFTPAVSPAFLIEDYDWASGNYSTWAESIWFDMNVGMFLKPSRKKEWITFSIGITVFFVSFIVVYLLNKRAKDIFNPRATCSLLTTNC